MRLCRYAVPTVVIALVMACATADRPLMSGGVLITPIIIVWNRKVRGGKKPSGMPEVS